MTAALETLPGIGKATSCAVATYHSPVPLRYVWHHILPQTCGGKTVLANLAEVCDSCHYTIHILMWMMQNGGIPAGIQFRATAHAVAETGYQQAVAAGTAARIPKEADTA